MPNSEGVEAESHGDVIPLLCSIFLANHGAGDAVGEGNAGDEAGDRDAMPWVSDLFSPIYEFSVFPQYVLCATMH